MNNGIKPTRLWHFTGKKHFMKMIKDRHEAVTHSHTAKTRKDMLTLVGTTLMCAVGLTYSVGFFSPKVPEHKTCHPPPKKKCATSKTQDPCPPEDPYVMPRCPGEKPAPKK